jgi:CelD/BcsL family acetyltransferase involved in cellulose biosynthesis
MRVVFSESGSDFVSREWNDLVQADSSGTFFQTPEYLKLYWEEFGEGQDLLMAFVEQGVAQVAACAFERIGPQIRFLGGTEVTDYLGPVAVGSPREMAGEIVSALVRLGGWTNADFRNIPEDSPWLGALTEAVAAEGLWHQAEEQDVCPFLPLPDTWDGYLTALPGKLRHEIKRKARRLESDGGPFRLVWADASTIDDDLERFFALHRSSEGPKGKFMEPGMEIFFRRLAQSFLPAGIFRLGFIEVNEVKVAGALGFFDEARNRLLLYNSAFDHEWKPLSPGMVLVAEMIRSCIEDGLEGFDLLKGGLEYKYRFGSIPRKLMRLRATTGE